MSKALSVYQINQYIKSLMDRDALLSNVTITGEVSNCKYHTSGHIYFSLKDEKATISCIMFRGSRLNGLDFDLKDGQSVNVTGKIAAYERDGTYAIYASFIKPEGVGALYEKYDALVKKLRAEGLFEPSLKKQIPPFCKRVGVVTAKTGAAIQDIINVSKRRNPYVQLILAPAKVQGEGAAESVVSALKRLDMMELDVIIVGRGGGSIEDLWAFNEEIVARCVASMKTPVISAVGHETDTTIIDLVSDLRAPTPSAAAELAVFKYDSLKSELVDYHTDLLMLMQGKIESKRAELENMAKLLNYQSPSEKLSGFRRDLDGMSERMYSLLASKYNNTVSELGLLKNELKRLMDSRLLKEKHEFALLNEKMKRVSPLEKISGGYAFFTKDAKPVNSVNDIKVGDSVLLTVSDGRARASIDEVLEWTR